MAFSQKSFKAKLAELHPSQQSIQTLSLWLIHHRKHVEDYCNTWLTELKRTNRQKKLTFIYLANDVIQNGKKKGGPKFLESFANILPDAFKHAAMENDDSTIGKLNRIIGIWEERKVFDPKVLAAIKDAMGPVAPVSKKKRIEEVKLALQQQMAKDSPEDNSEEVLEPEEILKLINGLVHSASSDAEVRQKIANLPKAVSDASGFKKITDKAEAEKLANTVEEASKMLDEYNERLNQELTDRKKLSRSLGPFIALQKDKLAESQLRLQEYKQKLENVAEARKELEDHIKNLPDLSKLPDPNAGLAPLPSAGDLFNV